MAATIERKVVGEAACRSHTLTRSLSLLMRLMRLIYLILREPCSTHSPLLACSFAHLLGLSSAPARDGGRSGAVPFAPLLKLITCLFVPRRSGNHAAAAAAAGEEEEGRNEINATASRSLHLSRSFPLSPSLLIPSLPSRLHCSRCVTRVPLCTAVHLALRSLRSLQRRPNGPCIMPS